jgi:hypothetical protein
MIIPSKRINFVHVPKAAGSSVGACLNKQIKKTSSDIKFRENFEAHSKAKGFAFPNHAPAAVRLDYMGKEEYSRYFSFAFVRNPFDLIVSLYEYTWQKEKALFAKMNWELSQFQKNILNNTFTDWVLNFDTGRPQSSFLLSGSGELLVTNIGKTETFDKDFYFFSKAIDIKFEPSAAKENTTVRDNYREYYNPETVAVIEKTYHKDLELFGYSF